MSLLTALILFAVVVVAAIVKNWLKPGESVGLALAYLLSLAMIHWTGALIHVLPWYSGGETSFVVLGFRQCAYGALAFGAGCLLAAPWLLKRISLSSVSIPVPMKSVPAVYVWFGVLFYTVLGTLLRGVPSFSAVAACGVYLAVVGLCIFCRRAWQAQQRLKLMLYLSMAACLPLLTILRSGFIGYGAGAALVVICFVFAFYRPRWQACLTLALLLFIGLSSFMTYFRDRAEIRDAVWGEDTYEERFRQLAQTFSDFEFIDFHNDDHLQSIENRLNQNDLVGRAVANLDASGGFAKGATFWEAMLALVPRILWPDKPVRAGSPEIVTKYTGIGFAEGTSVGVGQVMEFYINFGAVGIWAGFFVIGLLVGIADGMAAKRLNEGNWPGFANWFFPGLGLLQTGGSLVEVFGTVAASGVLIIFVNRFFLPFALGQVHPPDSNTKKPGRPRRPRRIHNAAKQRSHSTLPVGN